MWWTGARDGSTESRRRWFRRRLCFPSRPWVRAVGGLQSLSGAGVTLCRQPSRCRPPSGPSVPASPGSQGTGRCSLEAGARVTSRGHLCPQRTAAPALFCWFVFCILPPAACKGSTVRADSGQRRRRGPVPPRACCPRVRVKVGTRAVLPSADKNSLGRSLLNLGPRWFIFRGLVITVSAHGGTRGQHGAGGV